MVTKAICPSCGEWIKLNNQPKIGQKLTCVHCDADLEVVELDPVELDWAYFEEDEDWVEEDEEEWDER